MCRSWMAFSGEGDTRSNTSWNFCITVLDVVNYSSQMITSSVAVGWNGKLPLLAKEIGVMESVKNKWCSRCIIWNNYLWRRWWCYCFWFFLFISVATICLDWCWYCCIACCFWCLLSSVRGISQFLSGRIRIGIWCHFLYSFDVFDEDVICFL